MLAGHQQIRSLLGSLLHKGRSGATAVEFAILFPLFFFLVFGIIEFGLLMSKRVMTELAMHNLSRAAVVGLTTPAEIQQTVNQNTIGWIDFAQPNNCVCSTVHGTIAAAALQIVTPPADCGACGAIDTGSPGDYVIYNILHEHDFILPVNAMLNAMSGGTTTAFSGPRRYRTTTIVRNE